ncbi:MAG: NAD(+) synthase [Proteobacteria bacterium]|nr:NAD(+) synthase [Pseudomonadota bacterium]
MNSGKLTIAILQLNLKVGSVGANRAKLLAGYRQAVAKDATLVVAPELVTSGYPPKDNLLHAAFVAACEDATKALAADVGDVPLAFGTPLFAAKRGEYGQLATNSYVVAQRGQIIFRTDKRYPAQGGVFDEWRVHVPGNPQVWNYQGLRFGFPICEDIWHDSVVADLAAAGVDVLLVPNGSPTYVGKPQVRQKIVRKHVTKTGKPMLYFNHVGGQDEHVFDGGAFYVNPAETQATTCTPYWQESIGLVDVHTTPQGCVLRAQTTYPIPNDEDFILDALVLGTRDYLLKSSSLRKVVIGISGGVDSAVVLALAKLVMESAGLNPAENIITVSMPSKHNSSVTKGFASQICQNLGIPLHWWPVEDAVSKLREAFKKLFGENLKSKGNTADENTQSRERGQVLMAISNRFNALLLSTGNKSEMAMGYATLYGDMNGGFNPLKTLYKTQVYRLGHTINRRLGFEAIPVALIHQKPSAELDDNQFDENSLPPYAVLDAILAQFMDERRDVAQIMRLGRLDGINIVFVANSQLDAQRRQELANKPAFQRWWMASYDRYADDSSAIYYVTQDCVLAVAQQLLRMRFKRYQACPGVTITPSSFDDGERYPIANGMEWLAHGCDVGVTS